MEKSSHKRGGWFGWVGRHNARVEGYFHRVIVAIDMLCNVLIGGAPDQTLSSRCAISAAKGNRFSQVGLWILDHTLGRHHGTGAELTDLGRAEIIVHREDAALDQKFDVEGEQKNG